MTSTNLDTVKQSVTAFKRLNTDDRLGILALIYSKVAGSIPSDALKTTSPEVSGLVTQIEQISQERQVNALRDLLPAQKTDQDKTTLDPNPAKALTNLVSAENTIATGQYGAMSKESKLAVWYQIAQKLGSSIVAIPSDYKPSSAATELLNSLESLDNEQQISFLTEAI
jgi:hypothetical protein